MTEDINLEQGIQPSNFSRRRRPSFLEGGILDAQRGVPNEAREAQNARAVQVLARVKEKLTGRDFKQYEELNVSDQVDKLLVQATSVENICQHWIGWCGFW
jgi:FKBP12-rapamycin complex-associated protein